MSDDRPTRLPQPNEPPLPSPEPGVSPPREPQPSRPEPSPLPEEPPPAQPSASPRASAPPHTEPPTAAEPDSPDGAAPSEPVPLSPHAPESLPSGSLAPGLQASEPTPPGPLPPSSGLETPQSSEPPYAQGLPSFSEFATTPRKRDPFWGYSDLILFLGLAVPSMLLGVGAIKAAKFLLRVHALNQAAEQLAMQTAAYAFLFGALMMILRLQYDRPFWRSLGWVDYRFPVMRVVISGIGTALGLAVLATVIGTPTTANPMTELLKDRISVILVGGFGVTVAPLCEELLFRGFLQPLLVRSLSALPGIVAAAVLFGMLHFQEYGNSWKHALIISLAGAAFGWMRHATGSTKASTIMHASYNALFFVGLLGPKGGAQG